MVLNLFGQQWKENVTNSRSTLRQNHLKRVVAEEGQVIQATTSDE